MTSTYREKHSATVATPKALNALMNRRLGARNTKLGALLVAEGVTTERAVGMALKVQQAGEKMRLGDILVAMGAADKDDIARVVEHHYGVPFVDLARYPLNREALERVSPELAHKLGVLPFEWQNNVLYIVTARELTDDQRRMLSFACGSATMEFRPLPPELLPKLVARHYVREDAMQLHPRRSRCRDGDTSACPPTTDASAMLRRILARAVSTLASDIHVRPYPGGEHKVFLRIDGVLSEAFSLSESGATTLTRQLEVMSGMGLRRPGEAGEGRLTLTFEGTSIDVRVSLIPSASGSSIVMRVLDPRRFPESIDHLHLEPEHRSALRTLIARPHGLFLVTGPTGSGKTTTLYTLIKQLHGERQLHVATAEDPVEFRLPGINQFDTKDFGQSLRLLLRHDPDAIMVGELRDADAGLTAVNAAMTGHLVLSTIHANDSVGAIHRLLGLGVPPVLIGSGLAGVMSQRLVRLICHTCGGHGCENCHQTGYAGRRLVVELIHPKAMFADVLRPSSTYQDIRNTVEYVGGLSLDDCLVRMVERGETDWAEAASLIADRSKLPANPEI